MKHKLFIIFITYVLNIPVLSGQPKVEKLNIYKHFLKAGTTMMLVNAFKNSEGHTSIVDTTNINLKSIIPVQDWNFILNAAKKSKHRQMKVGGIIFAGEMKLATRIHYFVMAQPNLIVDLTDRINYRLDDKTMALLENYSTRLIRLENE